MEPVVLNLKGESVPTDWYVHIPTNVPPLVMPMPTHHKRIPKRSISFTSNGSDRSLTPSLEANSINMDSFKNPLEGLWANHEWNAEYVQNEQQQQPPQGMDSFEFSFGEHHGWLPRDQSFTSEMSEEPIEGAKSEQSSYETLPDLSSVHRPDPNMIRMEHFPPEEVTDFKHVIYNLLVEFHNDPTGTHLIEPCTIYENGRPRHGFRFNEQCNPEKRLPEMYVQHLKNAQLELENQNSPLIQDLYKFYMRSCVELLSKYFEKIDKYTYLYEDEDNPLFVPNGNLLDAEVRIKNMKTRTRKKKQKKSSKASNVGPINPAANLRATARKKSVPAPPFAMTQPFKPTPMS